ncbi:hypothetical protein [Bradyrhizobium betae]|uniref:Uncharacterized protein n=1 Tax=Bradyrhizobium betae TaxID=244734 RepID=A0A5P6P496_9BRAD|nr:hypothetical protein [Bradyrhizobium betae]MCS3728504.1 hypothetical protein [Bradyrhizobium betae]QFI72834.1 hypothetical protein F8237_10740 [Bradyrhizobium betae]
MSNVIQFCSKRSDADASGERRDLSTEIKSAALRASARDALGLLARQFELAIEHARAIEPRIHDPRKRQEFSDQVEFTQRLLDVAHLKILLL